MSINESEPLPIREVTRQLIAVLGPTLVSALAGATDRTASREWPSEDGPMPDGDEQARLRLALRAWVVVSGADGDDVARLWFLGANPWLGDESAISAIREDREQEVMNAAQAMAEGAFNG